MVEHTLMPVPRSIVFDSGSLAIDLPFRAALGGYVEPRLERAVARLTTRLTAETGLAIGTGQAADRAVSLTVHTMRAAGAVQAAVEDESYTLVVRPDGAALRAATPYGTLRGLETFLQLVERGDSGFIVPAVSIEDAPRFPWRGLLIDGARHFIPPEVIKRNIDAMAAVKLNVLHWHLTEDQGFRVESRRFPRLHEMGSDGRYYTQDQVREIVAYARDRGVRVVPEFDMPGHTTSWFVGHPELASGPGPYEIGRRWGVFDPAMDPTREEVFTFIDAFLGEMATLFPDPYFHIGGDEVNGKQWDASAGVQAYIRERALGDNHGLQAYFNRRLLAILTRHGKRMVGWDEIFHPDLPRDIVVQSWRGQESLAEGASLGYQGILSNGYYLDHIRPASFHYQIDPLSAAAALDAAARDRILGGEACMWAEYVTAETIDSRIWPRTAAIAERFWSAADVTDVDDMYRRLEITSQRLGWLGLTHRSGYEPMLRRLTDHGPIASLRILADVLEPVKGYGRSAAREYTSLVPLNRLVDATRPESDRARAFSRAVDGLLDGSSDESAVTVWLERWRDNHDRLRDQLRAAPMLREAESLSWNLRQAAEIGLSAAGAFGEGRRVPADQRAAQLELLDQAATPQAELLIMVVPAIRRLVLAAHGTVNP